MQLLTTAKGHSIEVFDDIDMLPIGRYNMYQSQMMQFVIGNSIEDLMEKMNRLDEFLRKNRLDMAISERRLIQQNFHAALTKLNFHSYAFAALVHSIDNTIYEDYSESGLQQIVKGLEETDIKRGIVKNTVRDLKKN